MAIIRQACRECRELKVQPVPKVRKPRITAAQLALFAGE